MELNLLSKAQTFLDDPSGPLSDKRIEELEGLISDLNHEAAKGTEAVTDAVYDALVRVLRESSPNSGILAQLWDVPQESPEIEFNTLLEQYPMLSITTIKGYEDLDVFSALVPDNTELFSSFKINGHGIRIVYLDGKLVSATSRARASRGRDLTQQMKNILGTHNPNLAESGLVEIRGEVALPIDKLEEARKFNPNIKSAFSAVSSLIKPSSVKEENVLLDFLAYRALFDGRDAMFSTKEGEYSWLQSVGFDTPIGFVIEHGQSMEETVDHVLSAYSEEDETYFCDGVVLEVNDRELFNEFDSDGHTHQGNIALKMGKWAQDMYSGVVTTIRWTKGKKKLSPVAIVRDPDFPMEKLTPEMLKSLNEGILRGFMERTDGKIIPIFEGNEIPATAIQTGVLSAQGNFVSRVPLYTPRNILLLEAYPGNLIHFRYGGEAGVVPCDAAGNTLTEEAAAALLESL